MTEMVRRIMTMSAEPNWKASEGISSSGISVRKTENAVGLIKARMMEGEVEGEFGVDGEGRGGNWRGGNWRGKDMKETKHLPGEGGG